jgi:hypothetical protein
VSSPSNFYHRSQRYYDLNTDFKANAARPIDFLKEDQKKVSISVPQMNEVTLCPYI